MRATVSAARRMTLAVVCSFVALTGSALEISSRYRSPRNPERKVRASTQFIVLHTTEAPARSSLNKLSDRGEAHFCVTEVGQIFAIVDRDREAFHAGRSMWNGREDVDKFSIGIECVGYHNKPMPTVQLVAIRDLVKELKRMYRIPDERVVCHSHVAYGAPNKWQKHRHRGRKRCGMLFAMPSVRRILELRYRPAYDPDTRAGRLAVGDDYLRKVLYANIDTMAGTYGRGTVVAKPTETGVSWYKRIFGIGDDPPKPAASKAAVSAPAKKSAKKPAAAKSAQTPPKTITQLKERGWVLKGCVSANNPAIKIAGGKWNAADTSYTIRDKVIPGSSLDDAHIEKGMGVWMKK